MINNQFPELIRELFGKNVIEHKVLFCVDDDNDPADLKTRIDKIKDIWAKSRIGKIKNLEFEPNNNNEISFKSTELSEIKFEIKITFIPKSLEKIILDKSVEVYAHKFSIKKRKELKTIDPHEALKEISRFL